MATRQVQLTRSNFSEKFSQAAEVIVEINKDTLPTAIGSLLKQNNYSVEYSVKSSGAETDIVASPIGNPFSSVLYIEATVEYVDTAKYGKDVTKFISLREVDPAGVFIIVSSNGFTADVRERAKTARVHTYTYSEFFKKFESFQPYIDHILGSGELSLKSSEYEEANFLDSHGKEVATQWFTEWAQKDSVTNPWIILLGEYGTGKTCLTEVLQYRLIESYLHNPSGVIPLRISLRDFSRQFDARTLVHHFLDHNMLSHIPIDFVFSLIRSHRIVLLLDGYDEMAQFMSVRERRACLKTLADLSSEGARGILTSRPNYFTVDEELRVFEALYSSLDNRTFHIGVKERAIFDEEAAIDRLVEEHILNRFERTLKDLTPAQTERLVTRKLSGDPEGLGIILSMLKKNFGGSHQDGEDASLAGKPVIITYLLEIIDEIKEDSSGLDLASFNEWQIYRLIIDKLMMRDYRRSPTVNPVLRRDFLQDLAIRLSGRGEGVARQDLFFEMIPRHFKDELRLLSSEDKRRRIDELFDDMRSSATLTRTSAGDGWIFSHNSLREYLVASGMIRSLMHEQPVAVSTPISLVMSNFVASMSEDELQKVIIKFSNLWKGKSNHPTASGGYLSLLWTSLTSLGESGFDTLSNQAGKAILLDGIRVSGIRISDNFAQSQREIIGRESEFSEVSFSGMTLSGSDFSGATFDGVNFYNCNLSGANFDNCFFFECVFVDCDFNDASLRSVDKSSCFKVNTSGDDFISIEGKEILGFLAFNGASTDPVSDFEKFSFHPKINIIEKILDKLSNQRNCQRRGLTQRGEAQQDPLLARGFVDLLEQKSWISSRGNMVGLTAAGREMVSRYFQGREMPSEFIFYLQKN